MKANELRIGNYVEVENYKVIQLENIHQKGTTIGDEQYLISMLKPIEITHDILLKAGFENNKNEYLLSGFDRFNLFLTVKNQFLFCDDEKSIKYVRFIHDLQNLYYAITERELKINL